MAEDRDDFDLFGGESDVEQTRTGAPTHPGTQKGRQNISGRGAAQDSPAVKPYRPLFDIPPESLDGSARPNAAPQPPPARQSGDNLWNMAGEGPRWEQAPQQPRQPAQQPFSILPVLPPGENRRGPANTSRTANLFDDYAAYEETPANENGYYTGGHAGDGYSQSRHAGSADAYDNPFVGDSREDVARRAKNAAKKRKRAQKRAAKQSRAAEKARTVQQADEPARRGGLLKRGWKSLLRFAFLACTALVVLGLAGLMVFWLYSTRNDFLWLNLDDIPYKTETVFYATDTATGEQVEYFTLPCLQDKTYVDGSEIPDDLRHAFVAIEDKDFYDHSGVDLKRTIFAVLNEVKYTLTGSYIGGDEGRKQGASTIDQQLIKNLTRDDDDSSMAGYLRKLREIWRAWRLDANYSKEEILNAYMNTISFTGNTAGAGTEAQKLFGKPVSQLSLAECASIAAITRNPARYNPVSHPDEHLLRRDYVLAQMLDQEYITQAQYDTAVAEPLNLNYTGENERPQYVTSYFTDALLDELTTDLITEYSLSRREATNLIYNGGLRVDTTVAPSLQAAMEAELESAAVYPRPGKQTHGPLKTDEGLSILDDDQNEVNGDYTAYPEAAMVSLTYNGGVAAVVGGLGEKQISRGFNRGMSAVRQVGSTMKPIGPYVLGIEKNLITWSTPVPDTALGPMTDEKTGITVESWPANVTNTYTNQDMLVCDAFAHSVNTVAVRIGDKVGARNIYNFITEELSIGTIVKGDAKLGPMVLGSSTYGIAPVDMAKAYAMFGNGGYVPTVHCYTATKSGSGNSILQKGVTETKAVDENTAWVVNRLMRQVLTNGTAAGNSVPGDMDSVGKTGTTSDNRDHWFIGLTPYYVTASWYGYDENLALAVDNRNHPPTLAWRNVMQKAQNGLPYRDFQQPSGVAQYQYCTVSGAAAGANCPAATGWYKTGNGPIGSCPVHGG